VERDIEVSLASYRKYLLALLMAVLAFNYMDRVALSVVLQEIKVDVRLTDSELGFLSGLAFAFLYAMMGIPMARWADRGNRVTIIAVTTGLWSVMVALTGRAMSFGELLLARIGVAIGEAGCVPPANSLIPDYFARDERPRAMAVYLAGGSLSLVIGYFAAGWLSQFFGWRAMFVVVGLPGVALAFLCVLTLREPRCGDAAAPEARQGAGASRARRADPPEMARVVSTLWKNLTFRQLVIVSSLACFFGYGLLQWIPTFFIRSYGYHTGELGSWLALTYGVGALIGTYTGGAAVSRYAARSEALQFRLMAVALCGLSAIWMGTFLSYHRRIDFALLALGSFGGATVNAPIFAAIQTLVPANMRAMAIAIVYLCSNLIGMGLGPLAAGALSEALHPHLGVQSLRYALLIFCPGYLWAAWHLWRASTTVQQDLRNVREADASFEVQAI
jgi:MFS family permease